MNNALYEKMGARHTLLRKETILAGKSLPGPSGPAAFTGPFQIVRVLDSDEVSRRREPRLRYPRMLWHVQHLVDVILNRKDAPELRRSLAKHMERLQRQYERFAAGAEPDAEEALGEERAGG